MSESLCKFCDKQPWSLSPLLIVTTPLCKSVVKEEYYPDYGILIGRVAFEADLIPLKMKDCDVILEINWLVKHEAQVDCPGKVVVLKKEGFPNVVFRDEVKALSTKSISFVKARKLLGKGCKAFIAYVKDGLVEK